MRGLWLVLAVFCGVLLPATNAFAFPWMLRHGQPTCATCHTDPSGGELLSPYGRQQGEELLAMRYQAPSLDDLSLEEPRVGPLWNTIVPPDWLAVGGSYRHALFARFGSVDSVVHFPMQADLYGDVDVGRLRIGASAGAARVPIGSPHVRAAQLTQGQGDQWNVLSRWHWVGVELSDTLLLRGGRLNLPFGLRISEHTAWVRDLTLTDRESDQQHGLALAYTGASARGELMLVLGNYQVNPDRVRERGYSGYFEQFVTPKATLGVSSKLTHAEADRATLELAPTTRQAHGLFLRWAAWTPVVLLAEGDWLLTSRRDVGYVGYAEVDLEPVQGLHFKVMGELMDRGYVLRDVAGDPSGLPRASGAGQPTTGLWTSVVWHAVPQLELRVDAIARHADPFALMLHGHLYL